MILSSEDQELASIAAVLRGELTRQTYSRLYIYFGGLSIGFIPPIATVYAA